MYRYILQEDKGKTVFYGVLSFIDTMAFIAAFIGAVLSIYFVMEELPILLNDGAMPVDRILSLMTLIITLILILGGIVTMMIIGRVWGMMVRGSSVYKFITYTGQDVWAFTMLEHSCNENIHLNKVENIKETKKGQKHYIEFDFYYMIQEVPVKDSKKTIVYNRYTDESWNEFRRMLQQLQ